MTNTTPFANNLAAMFRASYALVYVVTSEEKRALAEIQNVASTWKFQMAIWSVTTGWTDHSGDRCPFENPDAGDPYAALDRIMTNLPEEFTRAVLVVKDLHPFFEDPRIVRRLRDCAIELRGRLQTIVLLSPTLALPPELRADLSVVDMPLPTVEEIGGMVDSGIAYAIEHGKRDATPTAQVRGETLRLLSGLSWNEAENIISKSLVVRSALDPALIAAEKKAAIRKTEVLEIVEATDGMADVGGHELLREWLTEANASISDEARAFGAEPIKGALFVGVAGAGKSLICKAAANDWRLPLVRVDIGRLMGSLVGQSESRARELTQILEASSPVVAWFDEIEKGIGGVASSAFSDSGTTARVFGHLLTWMQETTKPVLILATANRSELLPPELLRRFDAIWWFDAPAPAERAQIWTIHLRKRGRDVGDFDLDDLVTASDRYTGAEIEKAVKQALRRAFADGARDVSTEDLVGLLTAAQPLAVTNADQIAAALDRLNGLAQHTHAEGTSRRRMARRSAPAVRPLDLSEPDGGTQ